MLGSPDIHGMFLVSTSFSKGIQILFLSHVPSSVCVMLGEGWWSKLGDAQTEAPSSVPWIATRELKNTSLTHCAWIQMEALYGGWPGFSFPKPRLFLAGSRNFKGDTSLACRHHPASSCLTTWSLPLRQRIGDLGEWVFFLRPQARCQEVQSQSMLIKWP